jgi:polygalacturonase
MSLTKVSYSMIQGAAVNVLDFGADPTGATDSRNAISLAFDEVLAGGTLYFPKGTYKVDSQIVKNATGPIEIYCEPGTVLDATASTDYSCIRLTYGTSLSKAFSGNVSLGQVTVTLTDASGISSGDLLLIRSTDNFVDDTAENLGSGEFIEVQAVSGNDLVLATGLADSYVAANTTISKVDGEQVIVRNIKIVRDIDNGSGLYITFARKVLLENCIIEQARERCFYLRSCYQVQMNNCTAIASYYTGGGTNYGAAIASCQQVEVNGGTYITGRHGTSVLMVSDGPIARYYTFKNCTIGNHTPALATQVWAADSHQWAEYITWDSNIVENGIGLQCGHAKVLNNRVYASRGVDSTGYNTMIYVWPYKDQSTYEIRGNTLEQSGSSFTKGIRINIAQTAPVNQAVTLRSVIIENNYIRNIDSPIEVSDWDNTAGKITHLVISKNTITNPPASYGIVEIISSAERYDRLIEYFEFTENYIQGKIDLNHDGYSTKIVNNTFSGLSSTFNRNDVQCSGNLIVNNNHFEGYSSANGLLINGKYLDNVLIGTNTLQDGFGSFSISKPRYAILTAASNRGQISADSTAPNYGKWGLGDVVFKATMVSAGYVGWACTTAGYGVRGAWSAGTTYIVGEQVTNGGNLYRCVVGGLGGAGPTTTTPGRAGEQVSGTATWEFISSSFTSAVFTEFGEIL